MTLFPLVVGIHWLTSPSSSPSTSLSSSLLPATGMPLPPLAPRGLGTSHGMPSNTGEKMVIQRAHGYVQALRGTPEQAKATTPHEKKLKERSRNPVDGEDLPRSRLCCSTDPSQKHRSQCRRPTGHRAGRLEHLNQHWS